MYLDFLKSNGGALPVILNSLEKQLDAMPATGGTTWQKLAAGATATVAVAAFAAMDVLWHTLNTVVKAPFTACKVTVAKWAGVDQWISPVFSGAEWLAHAKKIYASAGMIMSAYWGVAQPRVVLNIGRAFDFNNSPNAPSGGAPALAKG
jgi:hypothetical protein